MVIDELSDELHCVGGEFAGFDDACVACCDGCDCRDECELVRIVPSSNDEGVAEGFVMDFEFAWDVGEVGGSAGGFGESRKIFKKEFDFGTNHADFGGVGIKFGFMKVEEDGFVELVLVL